MNTPLDPITRVSSIRSGSMGPMATLHPSGMRRLTTLS